ncbi:TetR family transcriptional regulator [Pseudonocardia yuanmonensis]|uniref:TetR family transcriptional regulator n=1 Tax=Pseudonocardia yuanmonensis TaxID=1095914 RepID=A0ABP8X1E4_9PSEU
MLQRRGVERVQAILDAAEQLLETGGYEAATLKAIGQRAGIPTASVYHYFADRFQVDAELIRRHVGHLDKRIDTGLQQDSPDSLRAAVDAVVDPMVAYFRAHPSCVELWFGRRNATLDELVRAFDESLADRLWQLALDQGLLRAETPRLVMQLAFEAGSRLFDVAFRSTPTVGDDAVLDEARRLVTAYLQLYAP